MRPWGGTSNWTDHAGFYPRGTRPQHRLAYYAERLPMVEVNASFYRRIKPRDYAQWARALPTTSGWWSRLTAPYARDRVMRR